MNWYFADVRTSARRVSRILLVQCVLVLLTTRGTAIYQKATGGRAQAAEVPDAGAQTTGNLRLAALYVRFSDIPSTISIEEVDALLFGHTISLSRFIGNASYGHASLSGITVGPLSLRPSCDAVALQKAAVQAASRVIDPSVFSQFLVVSPATCGTPLLSASGSRTVELPDGRTIKCLLAIVQVSRELSSKSLFIVNAAHELGHNLGLRHAGSILRIPEQEEWTEEGYDEYGDRFSAMGAATVLDDERTPIGHYNAPHKARLGWLRLGETVKVLAPTDSVTLTGFSSQGGGWKAAFIPLGRNWLWFEFRQPDDVFDKSLGAISDKVFSGVLIHVETSDERSSRSYLLNVSGDESGTGAALQLGKKWTSNKYGVAVEVVPAGTRTIGVRVRTETGSRWFTKGS